MFTDNVVKACIGLLALATLIVIVLRPTVDQEFHEQYSDNLVEMQTLSKQLSLDILRAHIGYVQHFDYIEADIQRMQKATQLTRFSPDFVSSTFLGKRDIQVDKYQARLDEIRIKANQIKSLIGLVRNSDTRSQSIIASIRAATPNEAIATGLFEYTQLLSEGATPEAVKAHLNNLQKSYNEFWSDFASLIPHGTILSKYRPVLLTLINQTNDLLSDVTELETLSRAYQIQHSSIVKKTNGFLWLVSAFGAALVVLASVLTARHHHFREKKIIESQREATALLNALHERDKFSEQASTDALTGAYNRRAFWTLCEASINQVSANRSFAILALDLDKFKKLNDENGHNAGDFMLLEASNILRNTLNNEDIVARIGGDEFAALASAPTSSQLHDLVAQLYNNLHTSICFEGISIDISASIGAVEITEKKSLDDLLSDADVAMYAGRAGNVAETTWYSPQMRKAIEEQKVLSDDLSTALKTGGVTQVYQPIIDLKSGDIVAFEVLARWQHPERGNIGPDVFIDIAERAGLLPDLDRMMLSAALDFLSTLHKQSHHVNMQVNLSGPSITADLTDFVQNQLQARNLEPQFLTLELTETCIVKNMQETADVMSELVELGVSMHLDDFGTGYSSLSHLQTFPVNGLKIDRSFVSRATDDERSRQLVDASMAIASSLQLEVVAEGIETQEQAKFVTELGCDFGQGYLFSKPVSSDEAITMLSTGHLKAA